MKKDEVLDLLVSCGYVLDEEKEIQHGVQLLFKNGAKVSVYNKGTVTAQGKYIKEVNEILKGKAIYASTTQLEKNKQIFIVYGHDSISREQLEFIFTKLDINHSMITNNTGMTIIEALEEGISEIHAGIVLLTPDDMAISKRDYEKHGENFSDFCSERARQNVILEMGMLISKLGRENVIILAKGNTEIPSDIQGVLRLTYNEHIKEALKQLIERLDAVGFNIDKSKILEVM